MSIEMVLGGTKRLETVRVEELGVRVINKILNELFISGISDSGEKESMAQGHFGNGRTLKLAKYFFFLWASWVWIPPSGICNFCL